MEFWFLHNPTIWRRRTVFLFVNASQRQAAAPKSHTSLCGVCFLLRLRRNGYLFCQCFPPGRAWSRYALRVFSVTKCTSRVLAGIFLSPVDSVTLDAIRIGFSVIFIFQSRFKVYLFHSPNTAERWTPSVWVWRCFYLCNTIISYVYFVHQTQNDIERSRLL